MAKGIAPLDLFARMVWLDGRPLLPLIEPYRRRLFEEFFSVDETGQPRYNLGLSGRSKKNNKSLDAILIGLTAVMENSPHGSQVRLVANDEDQAGDDLDLAKKLIRANPTLGQWLVIKKDRIERRDEGGFLEVLPARDAVGAHGKTYRLLIIDEIHGYRDWDLLEALAPDPTRRDAQQWITSYASIYHRPGAPLFDLLKLAKSGADPRMLFSWYAADFTTDPDFADAPPERRANPSIAGWDNPDYLAQQQRRLPSHKYRRLHLNLPGAPEGTAYQAETVFDAIDRGTRQRWPMPGQRYHAFVDMSGGSSDDAVLGIAHLDEQGRAVLDRVVNQGQPAPFDPRRAIQRFVPVLREYGCYTVAGDAYAGMTFRADFEAQGIRYEVSKRTTSDIYESFEPVLNGGLAVLLDEPVLEQQVLALVWRGGKITHPAGEHDDWATAGLGAMMRAAESVRSRAAVAVIKAPSQGLGGACSNYVQAMRAAKTERLRKELADAQLRRSGTLDAR